jgi:hypothetical protein
MPINLVFVVTGWKLNDVPNFYEVSSPCLFHIVRVVGNLQGMEPKLIMQPNQASITRTHHTQTHLWNLGHKVLYTILEGAMPKWKGMILLGQICTLIRFAQMLFLGVFLQEGKENTCTGCFWIGFVWTLFFKPYSKSAGKRPITYTCPLLWIYLSIPNAFNKMTTRIQKLMMCCSKQWTTPPPQIDVCRTLHRIVYA